jgi:type VI secretion system Hcp family effector
MALTASLKVTLASANMKGTHPDGGVLVTHWEHSVESERDTINNKANSTRAHSSFKIRKPVDLTSPHFHNALTNQVELSQVQLRLYKVSPGVSSDQYATITLKKVTVQEIETTMPDLTNADEANVHEYEDVSFTYDDITWSVKGALPSIATDSDGVFWPDWVKEHARLWTLKGLAEIAAAALKKAADAAKKATDAPKDKK